jgi:hypothetical protein
VRPEVVADGVDDAGKPVARHPDKAVTIERIDFYDQEQFEAFHTGLQERKKKKILPTDPALYEGNAEDRISINQAAEWFNFAGPPHTEQRINTALAYLRENG